MYNIGSIIIVKLISMKFFSINNVTYDNM